ncbi:hypothetical protein BBO99_00007304 [Phytophthora kernoviae]|uniref:WW domain-containing protein n=1 Tax=Phytophthora kernoviae TaxID=325452 RepID=A0A421GI61_9STRA|nr:hypothetical protein BBI17_008329 [Phytophthora kernoviae]RLN76750.1 hypothetical protein BBO99_00007304 [Phytophthora kernoviae]
MAKAATIRMAYRNYVAKKFAWAAMTLLLKTAMANRIQRSARQWMFQQEADYRHFKTDPSHANSKLLDVLAKRSVTARWHLKLRSCARCFLSRHIAKRKRLEKQAAVCIQRAFRYSRAKRRLAQLVVADGNEIAATIASEWVELFDEDSGYVYYYHTGTGQSVWERPAEMDPLIGTPEDAASENVGEWVEYWDENVGASYFYNVKTGEATWTTPVGYQRQSSNQEDTADAWPLENGGTYYTLHPRSKLESSTPEYSQLQAEDGNQYYEQYGYGYDGDQAVDWGADAYTYGNNDNGQGSYYYYGDSAEDGAAHSHPLKYAGNTVGEDSVNDVYEPADTEYDINYKIYLTQIGSERQEQEQQQQNDQQDQGEQDAQQDWTFNSTKDA